MSKFVSTAELLRRRRQEEENAGGNGFRSTAELVGREENQRAAEAHRRYEEIQAERRAALEANRPRIPVREEQPIQSSPLSQSWARYRNTDPMSRFNAENNVRAYRRQAENYKAALDAAKVMNLPDNPTYKEITGAEKRMAQENDKAIKSGKDASRYQKALEMLQEYKKQYTLGDNTSPEDRRALYNEKKAALEKKKADLENRLPANATREEQFAYWLPRQEEKAKIEREIRQLEDEIKNYEKYYKPMDNAVSYRSDPDFEKLSKNLYPKQENYINDTKKSTPAISGILDENISESGKRFADDSKAFSEYEKAKSKAVRDKLSIYKGEIPAEEGDDDIISEGNENGWKAITKSERENYYYLLNKYGEEKAYEYLDSIKPTLQKRATEFAQEEVRDTPIPSFLTSIAKAAGDVIAFSSDAIKTINGEEINPYDNAHYLKNLVDVNRQGDAERVDEAFGGINVGGFSMGDVYNAGLSSVDMLTIPGLFGGAGKMSNAAYASIMSMGAAEETAKDLYDKGASNDQIIASSLAAGAFEYIFEKVSLDLVVGDFIQGNFDKGKLAKALIVSAGVEGSEEVLTEAANYVADIVIMREKSERDQRIQSYIDAGYSEDKAKEKAGWDFANDLYKAGVGGALSIGFIGAGSAAASAASKVAEKSQQNQYTRAIGSAINDAENIPALLKQAKESTDKDVQKKAAKLENLYKKYQSKAGTDEDSSTVKPSRKLTKTAGDLFNMLDEREFENARTPIDEMKAELGDKIAKATGARNDAAVSAIVKQEITRVPMTAEEEAAISSPAIQNVIKQNQELITNTDIAVRQAYQNINDTRSLLGGKEYDSFDVSDDGRDYIGNTPVKPQKVTAVTRDNMSIDVGTGEDAKATDISFADPQKATILKTMLDIQNSYSDDIAMTPEFVNAALKVWDDGKYESVNAFLHDVEGIYRAANTNAERYVPEVLSDEFADTLTREAVASKNANISLKQQKIENAKTGTHKEGKVIFEAADGSQIVVNSSRDLKRNGIALNDLQATSIDTVTALSNATGITFRFFRSELKDGKYISKHISDSGQSPNGFYKDGEIYVDINAGAHGQGLILFTVSHELTHFMRDFAPEQFDKYAAYLFENYAKHGGSVRQAVYEEMNKHQKLTYDVAYEEVVARLSEAFLRDVHLTEKSRELYNTDKGLWQSIKTGLEKIVDRIEKYFAELSPESRLGKMGEIMARENREILDRFVAGVKTAAENAAYLKEPPVKNGRVMYSVMNSDSFIDNVDKVIKMSDDDAVYNAKNGNFIRILNHTPDVILDHVDEAKDLETIISFYSLYLATRSDGVLEGHYHHLGERMKKLPDYLSSPEAIVLMDNKRLNLLSKLGNDNNGIISIELNTVKDINNKHNAYNLVITVFTGEDNYIRNNLSKHGKTVKYIKNDLPQVNSQLYEWLASINDKSFDNIIPDSSEKNNPSGENNPNGREQSRDDDYLSAVNSGDMETAQRMVDEAAKAAGYNIKAYHGASSYFNVFDLDKTADINLYGKGFYFTSDETDATDNYVSVDGADTRQKIESRAFELFSENGYSEDDLYGNDEDVLDKYNELYEQAEKEWKDSARIVNAYLKIKHPMIVNKNSKLSFQPSIVEKSKNNGYDGIIDYSVPDKFSNLNKDTIHYVVFSSEQIKSADPVTYDDNGKVIPLSERFNTENKDIRYDDRDDRTVTQEELDEYIRKEREEADKRIKQVLDEYKKKRHESVEKRNKTKVRHSVMKKSRELNKLLNRSAKEKTVKQGLRESTENLLKVSSMLFPESLTVEEMASEGVGDATDQEQKALDRYNKLLKNRAKKDITQQVRDNINAQLKYLRSNDLKDLITRERQRYDEASRKANSLHMKEALTELSDAYKKIKDAKEPYIRDAYDEEFVDMVDAFKEEVGNKLAKDLTLNELLDFNKIVTMMVHSIRNANKMFVAGRKATLAETGDSVMNEILKLRMTKEEKVKIAQDLAKFGVDNFKPVYAARYLGSETFVERFWNLQKGELDFAVDIEEAKNFKEDCEKKWNYKKFKMTKKIGYKDRNGRKFSLNLNQRMALYAMSRRPQGLQHLTGLGFSFKAGSKSKVLKTYTSAVAHPLSVETINKIADSLTANEKGYAEDMQKYLSEVMADKGNQVSLAMYGVKIFNEDIYWRLSSDKNYTPKDEKENKGQYKAKNAGFTHAINRKANNPVELVGFEEAWIDHVYEMSTYHGMVLPLEDITRVFNYRSSVNDESKSVKSTIQGTFSEAMKNYFDTLIADLNGGAVRRDSFAGIDNVISKTKKAAVMANFSVVVQQPSSVVRAMAYVNPIYFGYGAPVGFAKFAWSGLSKAIPPLKYSEWEDLKKYAPIAIIKEMGGYDTSTGRGVMEYLKSGKNDSMIKRLSEGVDNILSKAPEFADRLAWLQLWDAIQLETRAKYGYKLGTEQNKVKSGERFNEVVHLTQVYDSVLSRSGNMRDKGKFAKMVTAYAAEPLTYANMMFDAVVQTKRVKGFGKKAATISRVGLSVGMAIIANALLHAFPVALRDDDDDELYWDKYWKGFWEDIKDGANPLTYLPYIRDAWSIIESKVKGYRNIKIERMDMSLLSNAIDKTYDFAKKIVKGEEEITADDIIDEIGIGASFIGKPVSNIVRDIRSVINTYKNETQDRSSAAFKGDVALLTMEKYQTAYNNAYAKGYPEEECVKKGNSAAKKAMSDAFKEKYLEALKNGNIKEANSYRSFMYASGFYKGSNGGRSLSAVDKALEEWRKNAKKAKDREDTAKERNK